MPIPGRSSQSRYPEVNHWLPTTGNNVRRFEVFSCSDQPQEKQHDEVYEHL
jgi:hypothetical protein